MNNKTNCSRDPFFSKKNQSTGVCMSTKKYNLLPSKRTPKLYCIDKNIRSVGAYLPINDQLKVGKGLPPWTQHSTV